MTRLLVDVVSVTVLLPELLSDCEAEDDTEVVPDADGATLVLLLGDAALLMAAEVLLDGDSDADGVDEGLTFISHT